MREGSEFPRHEARALPKVATGLSRNRDAIQLVKEEWRIRALLRFCLLPAVFLRPDGGGRILCP